VTRPKWQPKKKPGKPHPRGQPLTIRPHPSVDDWLKARCILDPNSQEYSLNLVASWHNYCRHTLITDPGSPVWFGRQLVARGFPASRCSRTGRILRNGIRLNARLPNL
jgi:hypothetical protein